MPRFSPRGPVRGTAPVPGDKSIPHRALMLAAPAVGRSRIEGPSDGGDVAALRAMGARIGTKAGATVVDGVGVRAEEQADGLLVHDRGGGPVPGGGAPIDPKLDHRVAMSFAVAGLHAREPIGVTDMNAVKTSFPGFLAALDALSAA